MVWDPTNKLDPTKSTDRWNLKNNQEKWNRREWPSFSSINNLDLNTAVADLIYKEVEIIQENEIEKTVGPSLPLGSYSYWIFHTGGLLFLVTVFLVTRDGSWEETEDTAPEATKC